MLVVGNHDLEGEEFDTDLDNLQAWQRVFRQHHYWAEECGGAVCIGLSTTRFRDSPNICHEVYIDEDQVRWFENTLAENSEKDIFVFTHAPILGSGLKVVQKIHVKSRCAWLNHGENPAQFIEIVQKHPNIKFWFSGHSHLCHDYGDSISTVGQCTFVQVGVMGSCSRDGVRQSRLVRGSPAHGYQLCTLDHTKNTVRVDLELEGKQVIAAEALPTDKFSNRRCQVENMKEEQSSSTQLLYTRNSKLVCEGDLVVEYDLDWDAPIGIASTNARGRRMRLVDKDGDECSSSSSTAHNAVAVELLESGEKTNADGCLNTTERIEINSQGQFFRLYSHNKWRARLSKQQQGIVI